MKRTKPVVLTSIGVKVSIHDLDSNESIGRQMLETLDAAQYPRRHVCLIGPVNVDLMDGRTNDVSVGEAWPDATVAINRFNVSAGIGGARYMCVMPINSADLVTHDTFLCESDSDMAVAGRCIVFVAKDGICTPHQCDDAASIPVAAGSIVTVVRIA